MKENLFILLFVLFVSGIESIVDLVLKVWGL